jgi:hypothetical protein
MSNQLTEEIVKHIYSKLGIFAKTNVSLISNEFILDKKIIISDNDTTWKNNVWGCNLEFGSSTMRILVANVSPDPRIIEYVSIIQLEKFPMYGLYISPFEKNTNSLIAVSTNGGTSWQMCNLYLQATFLAGMESVADLQFKLNKCSDYDTHYNALYNFIDFTYDNLTEDV